MKMMGETPVAIGTKPRPLASSIALQRFGAIVLSCAIFVIDTFTSIQIAIAVLYVAVILITVSVSSKKEVIRASFCCIGLTLIAFFISHGADLYSSGFARCLVSLSAIGITTVLALRNKSTNDELQEQVRLLAQTHDAIIVRDMNHVITSWSAGAEALYGWSKGQAVGKDFRTLLNPQLMITWDEMMYSLLKMGRWEGEVVEHCRNGTSVTVISRSSVLLGEDFEPKAILATHNDISERKRVIDALKRSEAFLAGAQSISQTGSIGLKIPSGDLYLSEEAWRIFEFELDEKPSLTSFLKKIHTDDLDLVKHSINHAFKKELNIKVEFRVKMADGRLKYIQMIAQLIQEGVVELEYIGALMDVTDAKVAEETLHRSQIELAHVTRVATLGELAASIAHEVNQPLAAISTNGTASLRWLNRELPDLAEARCAIERMLSETLRASEVIRRIRAMARKTVPQKNSLNLVEVIDESLALVKHELKRNKVILERFNDVEDAIVCGDRVQLQQVIINLLMNGMQAMVSAKTKNRIVRLSLQRESADNLTVEIQDSGPGISVDQMPKLFDAFYTTKAEGMGMGLSICRSIIEAHEGRIWATCEPGEGAVFHLSLPLNKKEEA